MTIVDDERRDEVGAIARALVVFRDGALERRRLAAAQVLGAAGSLAQKSDLLKREVRAYLDEVQAG